MNVTGSLPAGSFAKRGSTFTSLQASITITRNSVKPFIYAGPLAIVAHSSVNDTSPTGEGNE